MRPIPFDLRCARCGYNLRGRSPIASCSECGAPVGETIVAVSLDEVGRDQLARLAGFQSIFTARVPLLAALGAAGFVTAIALAPSIRTVAACVIMLVLAAASTLALSRLTERLGRAPRILRRVIAATVGASILFSNGAGVVLAAAVPGLPAVVPFAVALLPTAIVPLLARVDPRLVHAHRLAAFAVQIPSALVLGLAPRG